MAIKQIGRNETLRAEALKVVSAAQQAAMFGISIENFKTEKFAGTLIDSTTISDETEGRRYKALDPIKGSMKIVDIDAPAPTYKPGGGKLMEAGNLSFKQAVVYKRSEKNLITKLLRGQYLSDPQLQSIIDSANYMISSMTTRMKRAFSHYIMTGILTGTAEAETDTGETIAIPVPVVQDVVALSSPTTLTYNLSDNPNGVYVVSVQSNNRTFTQRVILSR